MDPKLLAIIQAKRLVSYMNKTKWSSLAAEMLSGRHYRPMVQVKYVDENAITGFCHFEWCAVRDGFNCESIEWMRLDCLERPYLGRLADAKIIDHKTKLMTLLLELHISAEPEGGIVTIFGYKHGST